MESARTFDSGDEMDGPLCPTKRFHRVRDRFQFLNGVDFRQHQRPNGGNCELKSGKHVFGLCPKRWMEKGSPYDANDVALEEGAMWVIDANGDARGMRELILRGFLLQGISDGLVEYIKNLAIRNSVSRSLASFFPFSEGAMLSSRS